MAEKTRKKSPPAIVCDDLEAAMAESTEGRRPYKFSNSPKVVAAVSKNQAIVALFTDAKGTCKRVTDKEQLEASRKALAAARAKKGE